MNLKRALPWVMVTIVAFAFALYVAKRPMDFRVYHYGARGVFDGTRPVYGPASGLGWPMHYRYPPLFLLLFAPLAYLPLGGAAALWLLLKVIILVALVRLIAKRLSAGSLPAPPGTIAVWIVPVLLAGAYIVEDFRYGNAQFFVFALCVAGLVLAESNPLLAAALLSLGIEIKVWPLFFLPYLIVRRRIRVAAFTLLFTLILAFVPSLYFGLRGNLDLLRQWFGQEYGTQAGEEEIWFPSQSFRGVLMRYFTVIDYSRMPDSNYRKINLEEWNPRTVRSIWLVTAGAVYAAFLALVYRRNAQNAWLEIALAFCLIPLLEPFTQKYALVVLLFPAMIVARWLKDPAVWIPVYLGIVLALLQPLIPGAAAQRMMQVIGLDFGVTLLLAVGLLSLLLRQQGYPLIRKESMN